MHCIVYKHLFGAAGWVFRSEALPVSKALWEVTGFEKGEGRRDCLMELWIEQKEGAYSKKREKRIEGKAMAVLLRGTKRSSLSRE